MPALGGHNVQDEPIQPRRNGGVFLGAPVDDRPIHRGARRDREGVAGFFALVRKLIEVAPGGGGRSLAFVFSTFASIA
jgi:hypothetical protein